MCSCLTGRLRTQRLHVNCIEGGVNLQGLNQEKPRKRGGCSNTADLTLNHHPVCGVKEAVATFLDAAATPPVQEGRGAPCRLTHPHRPRLQSRLPQFPFTTIIYVTLMTIWFSVAVR